ncbi:MAG: hypothetical protein EOO61_22315 [Hymenobacter sp.]|nr:MAG: hypothetical protein EOO61_22315 [Hymenobacter sp.]
MDGFAANTLSGLIGALFGSSIAYLLTRQAQKVTFAFDLHKEFNTVEMGSHRHTAEELIKKHPTLNFKQLGEKDTASMDSLYVILRFYQRLGLAIKYAEVHKKLVCDMFDTNFYYWYYGSFKPGFIDLNENGSEHLEYLLIWFYRRISLNRHEALKLQSEKWLINVKSKSDSSTQQP